MREHSAHRLTYALNAAGQLVNVDEVAVGNECGCFCPACNEPLMAKNQGSKRMHHFAHQSGTECGHAIESMLHILAKEKIREAFLSKSEFWIEFYVQSYCIKSKDCKFTNNRGCYQNVLQRFDIKQYYDSCEQEMPYDKTNHRSDLKIFSSTHPGRAPIYLEFFVTHASDFEKLHSGSKIIEIPIGSVDDVLSLAENGIAESDGRQCDVSDEDLPRIRFYGFKNRDNENNQISAEIKHVRFVLYPSGEMFIFRDECDYKRLEKHRLSSLVEVCFQRQDLNDLQSYKKRLGYICFYKYRIPNCILCRNCVDSYSGVGKICRLYKHLQIPRDEDFDTARAKTCPRFEIDQEEMRSANWTGLGVPYIILE